jgi:hypothetical protein
MPGGWKETWTPRSAPSLRGAHRRSNPDATPGIAPGAGPPLRRRVAVRRPFSSPAGRLAGGQLILDRRSLHLRGRAGPPTRCADQAPELKFPVPGGQAASVLQPSRLRISGRDAPPDAPHRGRLASCAPWQQPP